MRTAMMAITTSSSISVNARRWMIIKTPIVDWERRLIPTASAFRRCADTARDDAVT